MPNTEQPAEFYDNQYFERMRLRHVSGAHSSRINNILSVIEDIRGKRILDVGCGDGWITNKLRKKGADMVGIDHSQSAVSFAKKQYPNISFQVGSIYNLKQFPEKSFDGILLIDILGHTKNLEKVFNEIKSILKPDGFIVASEDLYYSAWNKFPLSVFIKKSMSFSKDGRSYIALKKSETLLTQSKNYHTSQINDFTEKQFQNLFQAQGFKIVKHKIYPLVGVPIRDFLFKLAPKRLRGDHQCLKACLLVGKATLN